jgi:hypothetical protein
MGDTVVFEIPIRQATQPGMEAQVELRLALG